MGKGIKMTLLIALITAITICFSVFAINKFKIDRANKNAENIVVGDNQELADIEPLQQTEINYDDIIGMLTIPDILLENAPIREGLEEDTLLKAIGHFPSTNIYGGNVGLASHNSGSEGDFFRNLNKIKKGSEIYYQTNFGTRRYIVETIVEIHETDFSYLEETSDNRITLITCVRNKPHLRLCIQAIEN